MIANYEQFINENKYLNILAGLTMLYNTNNINASDSDTKGVNNYDNIDEFIKQDTLSISNNIKLNNNIIGNISFDKINNKFNFKDEFNIQSTCEIKDNYLNISDLYKNETYKVYNKDNELNIYNDNKLKYYSLNTEII